MDHYNCCLVAHRSQRQIHFCWYCKYGISYRDLEEMMKDRGVDVDHTTIYRWIQHYAPEMEKRLRWHYRPAL